MGSKYYTFHKVQKNIIQSFFKYVTDSEIKYGALKSSLKINYNNWKTVIKI